MERTIHRAPARALEVAPDACYDAIVTLQGCPGARRNQGALRPARLAWVALPAILGVFLCGCADKQIPPGVNGAVVWDRLTDPALVREPSCPDWRADTIAFQYLDATNHFHLGITKDDGSGSVLLTDIESSTDLSPRWVAAGTLVYASDKANIPSANFDLWYRDLGAGTIRRLTSLSQGEWSPAPRPGRPELAYAEGAEALQGRITLIPNTAATNLNIVYLTPDTLRAGEPDWDSSGDRICFSAQDADGSRHIWLITLADSVATSLTKLTTGSAHDRSPRFSPDGTKILFGSDRAGRSGVWWVSPSGSANGLELISYEDFGASILSPSWSPDGTRIVLSSDGRGGRAIWILSNLGI